MTDPSNTFEVYCAWPQDAVEQALRDFQTQMHDGAGPQELSAGLLCFDFLCRRSDLGHDLVCRIEGAIMEANMRIGLLRLAEAEKRTEAENLAKAVEGVRQLDQGIRAIRHHFIKVHSGADADAYDCVLRHVERRVARRTVTV